ncbi:MAG TPA: exodeoxyribonuclease VII small subunit [Gammaproteobacteria bacterium]|nr:exodeoxyribonuclease VII small subunit [Gammaproteobacteria bacterium]
MACKNDSQNFEKSLAELEKIVTTLEQGDISLEDSLSAFEKGVKLSNDCQKALSSAEQKINKLVAKNDGFVLESFTPEQDNS